MQYRREIDGLRALAVLPVILFHAGFTTFSGGFVGVDVFFVISGYLITSIILAELEQGEFSILNFYARRARRILPALFFVMFVSSVFAWLWLMPSHLKEFSKSLIAVSVFVSNIFFWYESGYFDTAAELKPLLHTWSLAVEEQYYVFFPIFLMLTWRFGKRWIAASLAVLAIISLALAQWGSFSNPEATFYLLHTRGWELLIGALAAFYLSKVNKVDVSNVVREGCAALGLVLILYSVFIYNKHTPFPGLYALVPTLGTLLIILFAVKDTVVGKLLGLKLFVGIGLLSYSAYLWHQPLFAFARYKNISELSDVAYIALTILTFILAYFSWLFIEKPFRDKKKFSGLSIFILSAICIILFIAYAMFLYKNNGFLSRLEVRLQNILSVKDEHSSYRKCQSTTSRTIELKDACVIGNKNNVRIALLGDSHATAISQELEAVVNAEGMGFTMLTYSGCSLIPGLVRYEKKKNNCHLYSEKVFNYLSGSSKEEILIILARWPLYASGKSFDNEEGGLETNEYFMVDHDEPMGKSQDRETRVLNQYVYGINQYLKLNKKIILFYPVPEAGWNVPDTLAKLYLKNGFINASDGSTNSDIQKKRMKKVVEALDSLGEHPNLRRIYPMNYFCDVDIPGRCIVHKNDRALYSDDDHLSNFGAKIVLENVGNYLRH